MSEPKPLGLADQKIIVAAADKWRTSFHDEHIGELFDVVARMVAEAEKTARAEGEAERAALAAAVDRARKRHPRGDEESTYLAPGLWCPTCGRERSRNGYGGCPDRNALIVPGLPLRTEATT